MVIMRAQLYIPCHGNGTGRSQVLRPIVIFTEYVAAGIDIRSGGNERKLEYVATL